MSNSTSFVLPNSLNLPPHLSAHKYFMVCTLTVAAWDTLVLSPRAWRLFKSPGWPMLKIVFSFLRVFMPAEFIVVGVAFFNTTWPISLCQKLYLFEPICTAVLLAATSAVHVTRVYAVYDRSRAVLAVMVLLYSIQIIVTSCCCAFYHSVPLLFGQGCISGPRYDWVGIYWAAPTLLYTVSFLLVLLRSLDSLQIHKLGYWKLMLRDGLSLYGATWLVNIINVLFWFITKPDTPRDSIQTIITSMTAVLTVSMALRIILSVRGSLDYGGNVSTTMGSSTTRSTHASGGRSANLPHSSNTNGHVYTLDDLGSKPDTAWAVNDRVGKGNVPNDDTAVVRNGSMDDGTNGVKITIDKEIGYDRARYSEK